MIIKIIHFLVIWLTWMDPGLRLASDSNKALLRHETSTNVNFILCMSLVFETDKETCLFCLSFTTIQHADNSSGPSTHTGTAWALKCMPWSSQWMMLITDVMEFLLTKSADTVNCSQYLYYQVWEKYTDSQHWWLLQSWVLCALGRAAPLL